MSITRILDDFVVWAFADPHGVRTGLVEVLREAKLIDENERWIAPARTALVGVGDYIDRGADGSGILELLFRLRDEAEAAGSLVVLCWGNHEAMLEGTLQGDGEDCAVWLSSFAGGAPTAIGFGLSPQALGSSASRVAAEILEDHPELPERLGSLVDAVIWRDVLFCHAGPVADHTPEDFAVSTTDHLWQFPAFHRTDLREWDLGGEAYAGYRAMGIERYIFGHESHDGPEVYAGGIGLCLDTNSSAGAPGVLTAYVTLALIPPTGSLFGTACILADTSRAPDRAR